MTTGRNPEPIQADRRLNEEATRYSVCTIVTRRDEYAKMIESFRLHGFKEPECEFLYLDNTKGNAFEAYAGYNLFLSVARGTYIVLCHQDLLLIDDDRLKLDALLNQLTELDPTWAACGNSGGLRPGQHALRISDPHGEDQRFGEFPIRVQTLDENFIIVRKYANLALSRDLAGFHFYGADICTIADILGWTSYVIDFHLRHKSPGSRDRSYFEIRQSIIQKYRRALRSRFVSTTTSTMFFSGMTYLSSLLSSVAVTKALRFLGRKAERIFRK